MIGISRLTRRESVVFTIILLALLVSPSLALFNSITTISPTDIPVNIVENTNVTSNLTTVKVYRGLSTFVVGNDWISTRPMISNINFTPTKSGTRSGNSIYWTVGSNTLKYELFDGKLKETLVITNTLPVTAFKFRFSKSSSLTARILDDGSIVFSNATHDVFSALQPIIIDAVDKEYYLKWNVEGSNITLSGDISGAVYPITIDPTFTKLNNPSSLPSGSGNSVSFSYDRYFLGVAQDNSPYFSVYRNDPSTTPDWVKMPSVSSYPTTTGRAIAFSQNSSYMAVGTWVSGPYLILYRYNSSDLSNWTRLENVTSLPTTARDIEFSKNDSFMAVAHNSGAKIYTYNSSDVSNWTYLYQASSSTVNGIGFSFDGLFLGIAKNTAPNFSIYRYNSTSTSNWTVLSNPSVLPLGYSNDVAFSPDGLYMAIAHNKLPNVTVYRYNSSDLSNWTVLPYVSQYPNGTGTDVAFSSDSMYMGVTHNYGTYLSLYIKNTSDLSNWTRINAPSTKPTSKSNSIAFSNDNRYMSVAIDSSPYIYNYIIETTPVANFTSNVTSGIVPLPVKFYDNSTNYPTSWNWSFGDGNYSSSQNPTFTYNITGLYNVTLIATNADGSNTTTKYNYINATSEDEEEPSLPVANFTSNVTSGYPEFAVYFTDTSENATTWDWYFPNGGDSHTQNATWTFDYVIGNTITKYNVSLNASNSDGYNWSNKTDYITAYPLNASFSANSTTGECNLTVQFTDLTDNGTPIAWNWSFGDGNYSNSQNPIHTYEVVGSYEVILNSSNLYSYDIENKLSFIYLSECPEEPEQPITTPTPRPPLNGTSNTTQIMTEVFIPIQWWITLFMTSLFLMVGGFVFRMWFLEMLAMLFWLVSAFATPAVGFVRDEVILLNLNPIIVPTVQLCLQTFEFWICAGFALLSFALFLLLIVSTSLRWLKHDEGDSS